jgi:hypothetical protein
LRSLSASRRGAATPSSPKNARVSTFKKIGSPVTCRKSRTELNIKVIPRVSTILTLCLSNLVKNAGWRAAAAAYPRFFFVVWFGFRFLNIPLLERYTKVNSDSVAFRIRPESFEQLCRRDAGATNAPHHPGSLSAGARTLPLNKLKRKDFWCLL